MIRKELMLLCVSLTACSLCMNFIKPRFNNKGNTPKIVESQPYKISGVRAGVSDLHLYDADAVELSNNNYLVASSEVSTKQEEPVPSEFPIQDAEVLYIASCVEAEAGNQDELGKRFVADCIINRYNTGKYSSYYAVIQEKNQFETYSNGTINSAIPKADTIQLVREEILCPTNSEIKFFRTKYYHTFGQPCFHYGAHYFSK